MPKSRPPQEEAGLAALSPYDPEHPAWATIIIETPKGSRNKYVYDAEQRLFELRKVLPAGMSFPYDFGFVPSTLSGDGDPLDVLVLMDEPAFAGCKLSGRLIGVIEAEQYEARGGKTPKRNDVLIAIEPRHHSFSRIRELTELGRPFLHELEKFFVNYHALTGSSYRILAVRGSVAARRAIRRARTRP